MPERREQTGDEQVGRALAHPLRLRILDLLASEDELSPARMAGVLGKPHDRVRYHVQVLLESGMLELRRTEPRQGTSENFYRSVAGAAGVAADEVDFTWFPVLVDERGRAEVMEAARDFQRRVRRIEKESQMRQQVTPGLLPIVVAVAAFEPDEAIDEKAEAE